MTESENTPPKPNIIESGLLAIVDRAREEIAWVRSAYKFAVSIIAVLIAVGLYFSHKSIQDLKSDLRTDGERLQKQLTTESSLLARTLQKDLEEEVQRIRGKVSDRINDEFKQENISELVTQQAQVRIDAIADTLIEKQIVEQIIPLRKDLTTLISSTSQELQIKVKELDARLTQSRATEEELRGLLAEARKTVDVVKNQSDFVLTVLAAQSDDRHAFEKLRLWATDNSFPLQNQAKAAELNIVKSQLHFGSDVHMNLSWVDGFQPSKMSIDDINASWKSIPAKFARAYVEFVWKHENITKEQKLTFLYDALKDSRGSLQAVHWAAKTLAEEAKVTYNPPFNFSPIEKWWAERGGTSKVPEEVTNKTIDGDKK